MSDQILIEWPGELLLKSAIIIAIGFILTSVFRFWAPVWKHRLWMRVFAIALFLPFVLTLPRIELIPVRETKGVVGASMPLSVDQRSIEDASNEAASPQSPASSAVVNWRRAVLFIWILGGFILLLRTAVASIRLHRLSSRVIEPTADLKALFRHLKQDAGLSRVSLSLSDEIGSPFTWGIINPRVLLPASANRWDAPELEMILFHELEHVRRRDSISVLVSRIFLILNWVNPLAWMAIRQSVRFREEACDLKVLSAGYEAPDYAEMLFRQAKKANTQSLQACSTAMAETGTIENRIQMILNPNRQNIRPSYFPTMTRITIFLVSVLFLFIGFAGSQTKETALEGLSDLEAIVAIEKKMKTIILPSVEFSDTPLKDALAFLQQKSVALDFAETNPEKKGINIIFDLGEDAANTKITLRLSNVPLKEALRYTTSLAQTSIGVEPQAIVVKPITPRSEELSTNVFPVPEGFTQVAGKKLSAKEILKQAGVKFGKGSAAIHNPSKNALIVRNTTKQLDHVQAFLEALSEGKRKEFLKKVAEGWEKPTETEGKLASIIIPGIEFQDTPFRDALAFLQMRSVELDSMEKDPAKKGINIILNGEPDAAPNTITLRLSNVPLGEAIRYTAALAGFSYTAEDDTIVFSPAAKK